MFPNQVIKSLVGNTCNFYTIAELNIRYNYDNSFIISPDLYIRITNAINYVVNTKFLEASHFRIKGPLQNPLNSFINIQKKGASIWSRIIKRGSLKIKNIEDRQRKTLDRYGIRIWNVDYEHLYQLNASIKYDNQIKFYFYLVLRDGLHTNIHRSKYTNTVDTCTFCNNFRETSEHLLWSCDNVISFRNEVNNNLAQGFYFLKHIANTAKDRILGHCHRGTDNFDFIFYLYLSRYIWISRCKEVLPELQGFKNYLNLCLKIQKSAKILTCLELLDLDNIWI